MIRTASRNSTILAAALLSLGTAVAGCNKASNSSQSSNGDTGSVQLELRVPGVQVDVIHWSISKGTPPAVVRSGDHSVPQTGPSAAFLVTALDPGPYTISLSANALPTPNQPDPAACSGTGNFTVAPGTTAHVTVALQCVQTPTQGGVAVDTTVTFEDCAYLTSYLVSSTQPGVGGTVDVSAAAADRDETVPLTYAWSAAGPAGAPVGTFADASKPTTTFTCPAGFTGAQTLTVYVKNNVSKKPDECPQAKQSILVLCVPAHCGDGVVQPELGEACDNGLDAAGARLNGPGTGCSFSCTSDTCGNGMVDPGEACDDGANNGAGKRCSLACTVTPICGDGIKDAPEACDDHNTTSGDGCSATCQNETAVCGNGKTEAFGGETCDDGNTADFDGCDHLCHSETAVCGNGHKEAGEQCDDGNLTNFDGCSATCTTETPVCGNGHTEAGEQCDDGNTTDLDGCSSTCKTETACVICREGKRSSGDCNALMGCDNLTDATDKSLCNGLLGCMIAHPTCWATSPVNCYCGTATGLACTTAPNGVCVSETLAAAKVGPTDFTNGSVRFFNTNFPSGHASQEILCDNKCIADGTTCP